MLNKLLFNRKYIAVEGMEQYFAAQFEKDRRSRTDPDTGKCKTSRYDSRNILSGLLVCAECGRNYRRVQRVSGEMVWRCANRAECGSRIYKHSPTVMETELLDYICDTLNLAQIDLLQIREKIEMITVAQSGKLELETRLNQELILI